MSEQAVKAIDQAIERCADAVKPSDASASLLTARIAELVSARAALVAQPTPEKKPAGFSQ